MKNNFYLRSKILLLSLITFVYMSASAQTISSNSPVCQGGNLQLTSSGGVSYSWAGPNGFTSTLQNPQIANVGSAMAGVYTLTIVVNSIASTATTSVIINPKPTAPIITTNKTVLCNGENATLTASGCTGTLIWNNGMTPTAIQITQSGTFTAICRNQCGDSNSSNAIVIRTSVIPSIPVVSSNKNSLCNTETAILSATGCNGAIQWNNGMTSNSITVSIPGIYSAICQNICGNSLSSNLIVINTSPTPSSPIISADKVILCNGEKATLTATGCVGTVIWSNGVTTNSVQFSFAGTYTANCVNP